MNTKRLDEILTPAGIDALREFIKDWRAGKILGDDLDIHVQLRDRVVKDNLLEPDQNDVDYVAYALAFVLGIGRK